MQLESGIVNNTKTTPSTPGHPTLKINSTVAPIKVMGVAKTPRNWLNCV
jgi:hypothetical protein